MRAYQQKKFVSFADQNVAANEISCPTEVKSFGEMCTQTDVLLRKLYHASSLTEDFDYLFTSNKKVVEFDEEFFRNSDNKVLFYTGLPSYEILNFVFELVSPSVSRCSQSLSPFQEPDEVEIRCTLSRPSLSNFYLLLQICHRYSTELICIYVTYLSVW